MPFLRPRVPTVRDSCNPVWEENNVFDFPIEVVQGQELLLELYDDDDRWASWGEIDETTAD